jgi:hypothetical protein
MNTWLQTVEQEPTFCNKLTLAECDIAQSHGIVIYAMEVETQIRHIW